MTEVKKDFSRQRAPPVCEPGEHYANANCLLHLSAGQTQALSKNWHYCSVEIEQAPPKIYVEMPRVARKRTRSGACRVPQAPPLWWPVGGTPAWRSYPWWGFTPVGENSAHRRGQGPWARFPEFPAEGPRGVSSPAGPRVTLRCPPGGPGALGPCGLTLDPVPGTHS